MRDHPRLQHLTPHERDVLKQAERTVAHLEQFLRERGLLTQNDEG